MELEWGKEMEERRDDDAAMAIQPRFSLSSQNKGFYDLPVKNSTYEY